MVSTMTELHWAILVVLGAVAALAVYVMFGGE